MIPRVIYLRRPEENGKQKQLSQGLWFCFLFNRKMGRREDTFGSIEIWVILGLSFTKNLGKDVISKQAVICWMYSETCCFAFLTSTALCWWFQPHFEYKGCAMGRESCIFIVLFLVGVSGGVCRSEENWQVSFLPFCHVYPGDWAQGVSLGSKHLSSIKPSP